MKQYFILSLLLPILLFSFKTLALESEQTLSINGKKWLISNNILPGAELPNTVSLTDKDYYEINTDRNEDGVIDSAEIISQDLHIIRTLPYFNSFQHLKIEKKTKTHLLTLNFYLSEQTQDYKLYDYEIRPLGHFHQVLDETAISKKASLAGDTQAAYEKFKKNATLQSLLYDIQNSKLVDRSCSNQEPFNNEYNSILEGVSRVLISDKDNKNQFLSCLYTNKLGNIAKMFEINFVTALVTKPRTLLYCEQTDENVLASYNESLNTITYNKALSSPNEKVKSDYYANLTFHEGLHMAGITEEKRVLNIENCCGINKSDKTACGAVIEQENDEALRTAKLVAFYNNLEGSESLWSDLKSYGSSSSAKYFLTDFLDEMNTALQKGQSAMSNCIKENISQEKCKEQLSSSLSSARDQYFNNMCKYYYTSDRCNELKDKFTNLIQVNRSKMCNYTDPSGKTSEMSCLKVARVKATDYLSKQANPFDEDDYYFSENEKKQRIESEKTFFAYFIGMQKHMTGSLDKFYTLRNNLDSRDFKIMLGDFFKKIPTYLDSVKNKYDTCAAKRKTNLGDKLCAQHATKAIDEKLQTFFRTSCSNYLTADDNRENRCQETYTSLREFILNNMKNDCHEPGGVEGYNPTCLLNALKDGESNYAHFDSLDPAELAKIDEKTKLMDYNTSKQIEALKEADRKLAKETNYRKIAWADKATDIIHLDPNHLESARNVILARKNQATNLIGAAGSAINKLSDQIIPKAQAVTPSSSQRNQVQSSPSQNSEQAAMVPTNSPISIAGKSGTVNPLLPTRVPASTYPQQALRQTPSAKGQKESVQEPIAHNQAFPLVSKENQTKSPSFTKPVSPQSQVMTNEHRLPASTQGQNHFKTQKDLIRFIQKNGKNSSIVKQEWFEQELISHKVQLIDDNKIPHGSTQPDITLEYSYQKDTFIPLE